MEVFPDMDIHFPEDKEATFIAQMTKRAEGNWRWQPHDAFGREPNDGCFYFHRDAVGAAPPCTLCVQREAPGRLRVRAIVPDEGAVNPIPLDDYVNVLRDFDDSVASPVAEEMDGMTAIGTSHHTLEDYFPEQAIKLLQCFCSTSNHGDLGTHLCDQEKWMDFLLYVFRNCKKPPHCDVFGACLEAKRWWPEYGIRSLVNEYDFAMRLLDQAG